MWEPLCVHAFHTLEDDIKDHHPFWEGGSTSQKPLRPSRQEFPVMQSTVCTCTVHVVAGRWALEALQGNSWREHTMPCTSNPQYLLTRVLEAFSTSSEVVFLPYFLSWCSLGCWISRWMRCKEILFGAKQPGFWEAISEQRTNEVMLIH